MRNQRRGARESKPPLEMSELYSKCPCPGELVGGKIRELAARDSPRSNSLLARSLLGVRMSFGDEADAEFYPPGCCGDVRRAGLDKLNVEILPTIAVKNPGRPVERSGLRRRHLYSRAAAAEEWV